MPPKKNRVTKRNPVERDGTLQTVFSLSGTVPIMITSICVIANLFLDPPVNVPQAPAPAVLSPPAPALTPPSPAPGPPQCGPRSLATHDVFSDVPAQPQRSTPTTPSPQSSQPNLFPNTAQAPSSTNSPPSESIDINNISPGSSDSEDHETVNTHLSRSRRRQRSPPRAGPHSTLAAQASRLNSSRSSSRATTGPIGNRSGHEAADVWRFIDKETRVCMLCE